MSMRLSREMGELLRGAQRTGPTLGWMHPSMRDLLINHLMEHESERRQFIANAGLDGFLLAISSEGGVKGERQFPLLRDAADWAKLEERASQLPSELEPHRAPLMLTSLSQAVAKMRAERSPLAERLTSIAGRTLRALRDKFDAEGAPIPLPVLRAYVQLSIRVRPLPPLPDMSATWQAIAPSPEDVVDLALNEIEDFQRFLALVGFVHGAEPRFLAQVEFRQRYANAMEEIVSTAEAVVADVRSIDQSDSDPFMGLEPDDDSDGDYSQSEEEEAATLAGVAETITAAENAWSLFDLDDRAKRVSERAAGQASIRESRLEAWIDRMRHLRDQDPDDRPYRDRAEPTFSVAKLFSDL